jgi:hypothetical protein
VVRSCFTQNQNEKEIKMSTIAGFISQELLREWTGTRRKEEQINFLRSRGVVYDINLQEKVLVYEKEYERHVFGTLINKPSKPQLNLEALKKYGA